MLYDAVFEGGGVKGIALAGAVCELESNGFAPRKTAGTSAGAIIASLLAAGYAGREIKDILQKTDFDKFRREDFLCKLGMVGKSLKILFKYGIYCSDYFESWLTELLAAKGKFSFGDLNGSDERPAFQAVASDLSDELMLVLPRDLKLFGFDEKSFSIAKAVRMSMSIPVYYEPYVLSDINGRKHFIVDGGLLSNYPIWLMDDQNAPCRIPVFGFKLSANGSTGLASRPQEISNIFDYTKSIVSTALDTHDKYYISNSNGDKRRTIFVPAEITLGGKTKTIKSTDFSLSRDESETLFQNGVEAARRFLKTYDYEEWERAYRK